MKENKKELQLATVIPDSDKFKENVFHTMNLDQLLSTLALILEFEDVTSELIDSDQTATKYLH